MSARPAKKKTGASRRRKSAPDTGGGEDSSYVKVYYPAFENLVLMLLNTRQYWKALQSYLKKESGYRAGLLLQGAVFFALAVGFLLIAAVFLAGGVYLLARKWTGSSEISVFIMFFLALFLALFLFLLMLRIFRKMIDFSKYRKQTQLVRHED